MPAPLQLESTKELAKPAKPSTRGTHSALEVLEVLEVLEASIAQSVTTKPCSCSLVRRIAFGVEEMVQ